MISPTIVQNDEGLVRVVLHDGTATMLRNAHPAWQFTPAGEVVQALVEIGRGLCLPKTEPFLAANKGILSVADKIKELGEAAEGAASAYGDLSDRMKLEQMSVKALQNLCRQRDIKITTKIRKPQLIEMLTGR